MISEELYRDETDETVQMKLGKECSTEGKALGEGNDGMFHFSSFIVTIKKKY